MTYSDLLLGLLDEDDNGATDLGALEKKLTERRHQSRHASMATMATASTPASPTNTIPKQDGASLTPQSALTSPDSGKDKEEKRGSIAAVDEDPEQEEVEALSEMMCSLVTNQSGETRYIGQLVRCLCSCVMFLTSYRLFIRFLYLFTEGYPMGQWKDG